MTAPARKPSDASLDADILVEHEAWPGWALARAEDAAGWTWRDGGGHGAAEVSILLADDATLRRLNRDFRGKDEPTNVLSFENDEAPPPGAPVFLGDMALAWETLAREAAEQRKSEIDHFTHLVVHGMLHLMGMDHEEAGEAEAMEARETAILKARFSIADPYQEETA